MTTDLFKTKDKRFSVQFDHDDSRYNIFFEGEKIVYSHWIYSECLNWLYRHEYITYEDWLEEMIGFEND